MSYNTPMNELVWAKLKRGVNSAVVQRAYGYLKRVRITDSENGLVRAKVQGSREYLTVVSQDENGEYLQVCTCPYGAPCKHSLALGMVVIMNPELKKRLEQPQNPLFVQKRWQEEQKKVIPSWATKIEVLAAMLKKEGQGELKNPKRERSVYYLLSAYEYREWYTEKTSKHYLAVEVGMAERKVEVGEWQRLEARSPKEMWGRNAKYVSPLDHKLLGVLANADWRVGYDRFHGYSSVGIDGYMIGEVLRLSQQCPLAYWKKRKANDQTEIVPLTIKEGSALELRMQKSEKGWRLIPWIDGEERVITTVFDYEMGLVLTAKDELIMLAQQFNPAIVKMLLAENEVTIEALEDPHTLLALLSLAQYVLLTLPQELSNKIKLGAPAPRVRLVMVTKTCWEARIQMGYGEMAVSSTDTTKEYVGGERGEVVRRDWEKEKEYVVEFEQYKKDFYLVEDVANLADKLPPYWEIWMEENVLSRAPTSMSYKSESGIDWLGIMGEVTIDEAKYNLAELILAGAGRTRIVELRGKKTLIGSKLWGELAQLDRFADNKGNVQLNRTQVGLVEALPMVDVSTLHKSWQTALSAIANFGGITKTQQIKEIRTELRPYQLAGVDFLQYLQTLGFGGILADDMGLGKTVQTLAILATYFAKEKKIKVLIVSPTSVVNNWERETARFAPQLRTIVYTGPKRVVPKKGKFEIVLTNYALLRIDAEKLKKEHWDYVILDEAQYAKNVQSQTAKVAREIKAKHRLCLTGTPIENNLSELYSQLHFLNPGMLGSLE